MSEDYDKALRLGQKSYSRYVSEGKYPYVQVLDEILSHADVMSEQNLGIVSIPSELIVGTYTAGRRTAFAPNFMPLLAPNSEFASKWSSLCEAHVEEGIRDPIKAYEYMNRYYVIEGNKRVSVLKYFHAGSIQGQVTRILPKRTNDYENRLYFEFVAFNKRTGVNYLYFSQLDGFDRLEKLIGKTKDAEYTEEELQDLRSCYVRFSQAYADKAGYNPRVCVGDAMLLYLEMYSYDYLKERMPVKLRQDIDAIWDDILLLGRENPSEIVTEPAEAPKKNFIERLLGSSRPKKLKIAFIHEKNKEISAWTYAHELGRMYLDEEFGDQVDTIVFNNVTPGAELDEAFDTCFAEKCDIIFTTTPQFLETSLKEAVKHPEVKILNCSVNPQHRHVRTYYARLFEAKYLAGMVAGIMAPEGKIGYIADYPISGMIANINAYALGAKAVNPRARVYLEWSSVRPVEQILDDFKSRGVSMISTVEMARLNKDTRLFGTVSLAGEKPENLAMPLWHWGEMYKKLVSSVLDGTYDAEDADGLALGYWWGMSAGAIDIIYSKSIPKETRRLLELVRRDIVRSDFYLFSGNIATQDGMIEMEKDAHLSPSDIIDMSWLADNVIGSIPVREKLSDEAKAVVDVQGVLPDEEEE